MIRDTRRALSVSLALGALALACSKVPEPPPPESREPPTSTAGAEPLKAAPSAAVPSAVPVASGPPSAAPVPSAAPSAAPTELSPADAALCGRVCERSEPLHCKAPYDCSAHCRELLSLPSCVAAVRATFECISKVPTTDWRCDEDGLPTVVEGRCTAEQARFEQCLGGHGAAPR